ncbi:MAG: phenylphosphate carboxylase subunit delta [Acidobacteriota bacterium]
MRYAPAAMADAHHASTPLDPTPLDDSTFAERCRALTWLLLDVDGVLTDGRLLYTAEGETVKTFHVRDGLAVRLAQRAGLRLGVISGRSSAPLERRLTDLDFEHVVLGSQDKRADFDDFLARHGAEATQVAGVGDDLQDLPLLRLCGLAFAPADADPEVRARVDRVLTRRGGNACVREMIESILRARGAWDEVVAPYFGPPEQ